MGFKRVGTRLVCVSLCPCLMNSAEFHAVKDHEEFMVLDVPNARILAIVLRVLGDAQQKLIARSAVPETSIVDKAKAAHEELVKLVRAEQDARYDAQIAKSKQKK